MCSTYLINISSLINKTNKEINKQQKETKKKMEQKSPVIQKKLWSVLRLFYYMLRNCKGVSKSKLWLDLNLMMKRAKIAGKAVQNLLFHHHHNWAATFALNRPSHSNHLSSPPPPPAGGEYEFSCTNNHHPFSIFTFHKKHHTLKEQPAAEETDMMAVVLKAMEMIHSEAASPALPGFGRSPVVRQLRVTDSPFPLMSNVDDGGEDYSHVDEAAEEFIRRFYNDLRQQKRICSTSSSGELLKL
uniref:uncharacterized protein LOC122589619 n=1 Tax=Erigeron canadensis TaxID=72917 RepID=UPI001CB9359A|nr:uncharacterized protein LOC122589619 [Erigeron canadensis]